MMRRLLLCIIITLLFWFPFLSRAAAYNFVEIARGDGFGGGPFTQFQSGGIAINDVGRVVFRGNLDPSGTEGLFTGTGGPVTTIVTKDDFVYASFTEPTIDNNGTVLFRAGTSTTDVAVLGGNGGSYTTYAPAPADPFIGPNWGGYVINNNGTVVLNGGVTFVTALYKSTGSGGPSLLYDSAGIDGIGAFYNTDINDSGGIAAIAGPNVGIRDSIVLGDANGMTLEPIVAPGDGFVEFTGISINDIGTVAFGAKVAGGPLSIYTGNTTTGLIEIANLSGPYSMFNYSPAINNAGTVAFFAQLDTGGVGIFTGPDPISDKVIATGDLLFDSIVTNLVFDRFGLNNGGQLAFWASLANGNSVIVRVDPQVVEPIPEPTTMLLLGSGIIGLVGFRRKFRKK
ncbi:PEP-CTERM sorting domain-containing protein [Thermodesulfobacteriota bacterium]